MNATCTTKENLLMFAQQMLDPSEQASVRAHLAGCARCREIVEGYEDLSAVLDEWKAPESWPWFDARLRAAIAARGPGRAILDCWRFVLRRWTAVLGMAAVTALALCMVLLVGRSSRTRQIPVRAVSPPTAPRGSSIGHPGEQAASTQPAHESASGHSGIGAEEPNAAEPAQAEDDEMFSSFDVLSELPRPQSKQADN